MLHRHRLANRYQNEAPLKFERGFCYAVFWLRKGVSAVKDETYINSSQKRCSFHGSPSIW